MGHCHIAFITKRSVLNNVTDTKQWQDTGFAKFRLAFEHAGIRQPISLRGWYRHMKPRTHAANETMANLNRRE